MCGPIYRISTVYSVAYQFQQKLTNISAAIKRSQACKTHAKNFKLLFCNDPMERTNSHVFPKVFVTDVRKRWKQSDLYPAHVCKTALTRKPTFCERVFVDKIPENRLIRDCYGTADSRLSDSTRSTICLFPEMSVVDEGNSSFCKALDGYFPTKLMCDNRIQCPVEHNATVSISATFNGSQMCNSTTTGET